MTRPVPEVGFLEAVEDVSAGNEKIPQSEYLGSGNLAVVDQGRGLVAGYVDDFSRRVKAAGPLIVFGDHTRAIKFVDFPFAIGADGVKVLQVASEFDAKFVYHYLRYRDIPSAGYSRHFKYLKEIRIPRLDIDVQRRIAEILDQADAIRTKRHEVLAHLEALEQSTFQDMFGGRHDRRVRLDSLIDQDDRMNYGVVQPGGDEPDGVALIRVSNLVGGRVARKDIKRIAPGVEASYVRSRIRGTEILVSCVGSIGAVSLVSDSDIGSNVARAITRVPIGDPVTRAFVAAYLRTGEAQRYFASELRTVAQPTLNVKQLAATSVPLPPPELRETFVHLAAAIDLQRSAVEQALLVDDELFASLQSQAFRGEL